MVDEHRRSTSTELPAFDSRGRLPKGIHKASWDEFTARFATTGRRRELLLGLIEAIELLRQADCPTIYIAGSFVTAKQKPGDIDVVWEGIDTDWRYLRRLEPLFFEMTPGSPRQKARFGCEFFPAQGIELGSGQTYYEFFQRDRHGRQRGMVRIEIGSL